MQSVSVFSLCCDKETRRAFLDSELRNPSAQDCQFLGTFPTRLVGPDKKTAFSLTARLIAKARDALGSFVHCLTQPYHIETILILCLRSTAGRPSRWPSLDRTLHATQFELSCKSKVFTTPPIQQISVEHTGNVPGGSIGLVFYDVTTLYFETDYSDELRERGFSKDGKHSQPQVELGLPASAGGYPLSYSICSYLL
jgi:hypothetical protein